MQRFAPVALATILAATAPALLCAQAPTPFTVPPAAGHFTDPANLAGERVRPRDGRELPIDGGLGADGKPDNALGLAQMLRRLNTRASLMLIVAHPDDEDGGMLTYYSRGLGARVAILTLNRGEGGQNAMTGDFDDALGLLRTQELLSADRYMGVETQMFGTEVDFGFTKTKQEAFQKWNHQRVLYDAVRAVRIFRPLIIASTFEGAVTDGHGQHQVSGEIAQEVFKAAGDPSVFPELTKEGILPWQPLKVFARVPFSRVSAQGLYDYATGQTVPAEFTNYVTGQKFTTTPTADVTINEGQPDPLLTYAAIGPNDLHIKLSDPYEQLSYVQFARIGLGLQRSQIGGGERVPRPGRVDASYHLYGSRVCAANLPNPTPDLCTPGAPSSASERGPQQTRLLGQEGRQGGVSRVVARDKNSPVQLVPTVFTTNPNSVILSEGSHPRAETSNPVILSDRSAAKGVEEPRGSSTNEDSSSLFNPALANQPSFFDGIDTSWSGIASLDPGDLDPVKMVEIERHAQNAASAYPAHPDRIAPELATTLKYLDEEIASVTSRQNPTPSHANILHELKIKRSQLEQALTFALGLSLDATTTRPDLALGESEQVALRLSDTISEPLAVTFIGVNGDGDFQPPRTAPQLSPAQPLARTRSISAPPMASFLITKPYFYRHSVEQPVYDLLNERLRNAPQTPAPFTAEATVSYQGITIRLERRVHSGSQPVSIIPPVSLSFDSRANVVPESQKFFRTEVHIQNLRNSVLSGTVSLGPPTSWSLKPTELSLTNVPPLSPFSSPVELQALPPAHSMGGPLNPALSATVRISSDNRDTFTEGFRPVGYGSLPRTNYYTPATLRVVPVDLKLPPENKRRIAYLPGTGDDVPAALASIGLAPTILKVSDLTPANLAHFDTVILGVRTYNAHPDLHGGPTQALLEYTRNGGNVVVQYQTNEFSAADAPYPLELHGERVIDETAPVVLLTTANSKLKTDSQTGSAEALLTTPNKITEADFSGWIEERGHGFLDTWDSHYTALTETHDPGAPAEHIRPQDAQRGGLITVQLGKGRWTYCAFALYRQLPEAVPGAFRLFVNLLNP